MLNWIWLGLVLLAVLLGAMSGQLAEITGAAFERRMAAMTLALPLAGIMALWLGVMRLAEKSGLVGFLAAALRPIMRWLFPDVPAKHPAMGSMVMHGCRACSGWRTRPRLSACARCRILSG